MAGFTPISLRILLWRSAYTHNKSPLPAQWIHIRDQLLTDFYTVGILSKKFYNAGRWKFLIAIDSVLNLELAFFAVFFFFDWLDFHIACLLFKKNQTTKPLKFFLLIILLLVHIFTSMYISVFLLSWHTGIYTCTSTLICIMLPHTDFCRCSLYLDIRASEVYKIGAECESQWY